ncbi:MAG TPA: AbiV family abortive infection protein [Pedobacter sp.]|nr:AbiV family abortive infection protein [Pedobacter sp.]
MDHEKGFKNLNAKESAEVFPSVIDNAERHFAVAHHISTIYEYPNAVAHLILGAEELVKATMLILKSKSVPIKNATGYDMQFFAHGSGHQVLKEFFAVWFGIREILNVRRPNNDYTLKEMFNMVVTGFVGIIKGKDSFRWWEQADALKQKCLYVDFKNELILPDIQVGKSDYNQAYHHVYNFRYEFYLLHHKLLNSSVAELTEFRERLEDGEFLELLAETLKKRKVSVL